MRAFLIILGGLLTLDTAALQTVSNGHLGTVLPAICGVPLLIWGVFYPFFTRWFATPFGHAIKCLFVGGCLALLAFFMVMTCVLGSAAAKKAAPGKDVLIVLGCGVRGERVSLTLKYRLDKALEYLESSPDTAVIVTGGQGPGENIPEALAMQRYLVQHGIEESRIIMEDKSTSTWENFEFCKPILDERFPGGSVAFVTTSFHVYRSLRVAKMHGIDAESLSSRDMWYTAPNNYLREGIAVVIYKLRGQLI